MICETCGIISNIKYASGRFCSRKCANIYSSNQNKKERCDKISKTIKNKLLSGDTIGFAKINNTNLIVTECPICGKNYETRIYGEKLNKKTCSIKCGRILGILSYKKNKIKICGGYRKGSGRGKSGWYKNYWCDSSYELAYVIYNIEHNIIFERNNIGFEYHYNGKIYKYYPDFIVNGTYVEIKGYKNNISDIKIKSFKHPIIVLYKTDLNEILKYVIDKYGKDFIKLYEGNPYLKLTNTCKVCGSKCKSKNKYCSRKCGGIGVNRGYYKNA